MPAHSISWSRYSTNVRIKSLRRLLVLAGLGALDRVMPPAAEALVKAFFFQPPSRPISSDWQLLLDQGQPFSLKLNGQCVAAWRWGQGPAVLLVHGWGSRGIRLGAFIEPLLRQGRSVIAFDGPGHGQSEGRTSSYFEMVDAVSAFIAPEAGFDITGIIGHSFGAGAVVRAVSGQSACHPTVALVAPSLKLRQLLAHTFDHYGIPNRIIDRIIRQFERRFGYRFSDDDPWRHLSRLSRPVLIVHDEEDRVVGFDDSKELADEHTGVHLHPTQGLGHRRLLSDPAVVARVVDHICADVPISGSV